ncbi:acetate--CoA ligase family protein [Escherichia coli]
MNTLPTWIASDSTEAVHIAEQIGYPVALKLRSPDIPQNRKFRASCFTCVQPMNPASGERAIFDRVKMAWPQARVHGLLVQSMANRAGASGIAGYHSANAFGPVNHAGEGGVE